MATPPVLPGDATIAARSGFGQGFGVAFGGIVTTVQATLAAEVVGGAVLASNGASSAVVMSPALQTT